MILAVLLAASALPAAASTVSFSAKTCPVCLAGIFYRVEISATIFDTRPDLKPLGMISARELASWREVTASAGYRAIADRSSYHILAYLAERLGGESRLAIADAYRKPPGRRSFKMSCR